MLRTIAFVVMMVVGTGAALSSRFGGLLFYLWFALFRPQEWVWADISRYRPSLIVGMLFVVPSLMSGVMPNITHPLSILSILFLLTGFVSQLGAIRPDIGWTWLNFLATLVVVCLFLVTTVNSRRRYVITVAVVAASFGYYPAKAGLSSLLHGGVRYTEGLGGAFGDNNGYALGTVMILPFLVAAGQNVVSEWPRAKWGRMLFLASTLLGAYTVVSLFSRGGFLALATATLVYVALQRRRLLATLLLVLTLSAAVLIVPFQAGYTDRLSTIQSYEKVEDQSALGRLHFWGVAVEMARQNPFGVGLFNYPLAYDRYDSSGGAFGPQRSVHSSHFQVLAENGFFGAFVWCGLFVVAMSIAFRIRGRSTHTGLPSEDAHFLFTMANALLASMSGFLVGGAFLALALNDLTWLTFALVAALDLISLRMVSGERAELAAAQPA